MACSHISSAALPPPTPASSVYREDCTQCFDSIDDPDGLDVCLHCFHGACAGSRQHTRFHAARHRHPLALNIRRTKKTVERAEPPAKMSKLAISAETDADRYDTALAVRCLDCAVDLDRTDSRLAPVVDGIMHANTFSTKEEVRAWEHELTTCEHILMLQQQEGRAITSGELGHCSGCALKENLWLCLECGNLGCGRKQLGGLDGNSHALAHATALGHGVAVKLGSITPEGTADMYCYKCDEERLDDELGPHLAHWGILLAERQKTEKTLTEMQIEQNMKWDFSMTAENGQKLQPLFGPGLTGLKNLGNSCYLASILQCLLDLPAFKERFWHPDEAPPDVQDPAADLETQMRKIADGLCSGRYSKPDSSPAAAVAAVPSDDRDDQPQEQRGLAPAMLKHLVGRGHAEFSTMRQQDAFELFQHLLKLISRSSRSSNLPDPTRPFRFVLEQRLQCLGCKKVRFSSTEQDNIFVDVPLEKVPPSEGTETKGDTYKVVSLKECLDIWTGTETVELACAACGGKEGFLKQSLFKTLPDILAVSARKMTVVNWVPIKVDVPLMIPDGPFPMDEYLSKGIQPGEEELPDEPAPSADSTPAFTPNAEALTQLEGMGFPRNRCERALHATGNENTEAAMEWLFGHMEDPDIDQPLSLGDHGGGVPSAAASDDPEKLEMLGAMGFAVPVARKALRETGGDVERAVEWLFSHPDDQGIIDDGEAAGGARADAPEAPKEPTAGSAQAPANYQLQSIVCHKGTSIHAGHYVAFIRKQLPQVGGPEKESWVLFNDEKVVKAVDFEEMSKFAYVYFFRRR